MLQHFNNENAKDFARVENARLLLPSNAPLEDILKRSKEKDIVEFVDKAMLRKDFILTVAEETGLPHYAEKMAKKVFDKTPDVLMPHMVEWCKGEPFSDIDYHGITINTILNWKPKQALYKADAFIILQQWEKWGHPPVKDFLDEYFQVV